jgi:tetratricopeptide (TPR) repeat protein
VSDSGNRVFGPVAGQVVQAGAVHGGVHFHAVGTRPLVPQQLLPPPPGFTNRVAELAFLNDQLERPGVVVVKGQGGVGKTALALHWLNSVAEQFPDGQLYADLTLSTAEPVASEDILGQFLRSLGVPPRRVPEGFPERTALYRTLTANKAVAVLLDDAVSAAQVRALLPASTTAVTFVTSRRPLLGLLAAGARTLSVEPLDRPAALQLLGHRIGQARVEAERRPAEELVSFCGGLPIALCVAGARAAARPRRSLARMVEELADERVRLDALSAEGDLSVRSMLDIAYSDLPEDLRLVYCALGLHPEGQFGPEVVSAMIEVEPLVAHRALDALVDASLAEELGQDHYRLHDLVRVHALDHAAALPDRFGVLRRAMEWYLHTAQAANRIVMPARAVLAYEFTQDFAVPQELDGHGGALGWLAANRGNLLTMARDALNRDWAMLCYQLVDALQPLLILHKHRADAVAVAELGLRAAQAFGDSAVQARARKHLTRVHIKQGNLEYAEQLATELLAAARAGGDRREEANALKTVALVEVSRGRFEAAAEAFGGTVEILRGLGERRGEGLALINFGETLIRLGRSRSALAPLARARDLLRTLGAPDPYNQARAIAALAQAHVECDELELAQPLLEQALTVFAEQESHHERARAHRLLAELARRAGDEQQAHRHDALADTLLANADR